MTRAFRLRVVTMVLAAVLVAPNLALTAEDQQGPAHHGRWEERLRQELGLSDQQAQAIREIFQRQFQARKTHWQALRQAQSDLRRLVLMQADEPSIQAKQDEVQRLLGESVQMRVSALKEVTPILTPEQREKYAALVEQGRWHRLHHRHRPS